eukprot:g5404.t1
MNTLINKLHGRNAFVLTERTGAQRARFGSRLVSLLHPKTHCVSFNPGLRQNAVGFSETGSEGLTSTNTTTNDRGKLLEEWDIPLKLTGGQWFRGVSLSAFICFMLRSIKGTRTSYWFQISLLPVFILSLIFFRLVSLQTLYEGRKKTIEELVDMDSQFLTVDGVKVHYKSKYPEEFTNQPLSFGVHLYHGFGDNLECWTSVQQVLANRCNACVTSADLTGFGLTERPRQIQYYTCKANGKTGRAVLDNATQSSPLVDSELPTVLIGHSLGGLVTLVETVRNPRSLAGVVLVSPAVFTGSRKTQKVSHGRPPVRALRRILSIFSSLFLFIVFRNLLRFILWISQPLFTVILSSTLRRKSFWNENVKLAYVRYPKLDKLVNKLRFPLLVRGSERGLLRFTSARAAESTGQDLIDAFSKTVRYYRIPVLIIHGERDRLVPVASSERLSERLGDQNPEFQMSKERRSTNPRVYLDVSIAGESAGRMVFELRADIVPKTVENFRVLCTNAIDSTTSSYQSCVFHRVIPHFMCQSGDFENGDGTGGSSIYGKTFPDENFTLLHDRAGVLSMANCGPDTNGSQFFICTVPCPWLDKKHVVFGEITEGLGVLRRIELCGTKTGKPKKRIVVEKCGELGSNFQKILQLEHQHQEQEKQDASVCTLDPDRDSISRIQRIQNPPVIYRTAQDELETLEKEQEAPEEQQVSSGDEEESELDVEQMSDRQRRLYLLQEKLRASRRANQEAIVAESRRRKQSKSDQDHTGTKKRWFEERKKKQEDRLESMGLTPNQSHRLETAEIAEDKHRKNEKKSAPFGWDVFNQKTLYKAYEKRADKVPYTLQEYQKQKELNPELYETGEGGLLYGHAPRLPEENIDRMVNELNEQDLKRDQFSRRRKHYDERDIDFINDRNRKFNQKIDRAFGKYTVEIKGNLERGTALPDN